MWSVCLLVFLRALTSAAAAAPHPLIVGGQPADIEDFPWQVAVETPVDFLCGGSVISGSWALTAAHPIDGLEGEYLSVRAGTSARGSGGVAYDVTEAHIHHSFSWANGDYDIALLNILGSFTFGPNIQAVNLADSDLAAGTEVNITGWGYTNVTGPASEQLLAVATVTIAQSACNATWGDVTDNMFCTQSEGESACTGDGGAAVVVGTTQYGVLSRSMCGVEQAPEVHISVFALRSWISELAGV